jgi:hypothetical protein
MASPPSPPPPPAAAFALPPLPEPRARPAANEVWLKRLRIPREDIPDAIGDMPITPALLEMYAGHEFLLKARAKHPEHCRPAWDVMRLCVIQRYDKLDCEKIAAAYAPCAKELERASAAAVFRRDDERRRDLAARAKAVEQARRAAANAAAAAAGAGGGKAADGGGH